MMKKKALTQIAFEFISIVFAVLLALGLSTYKNSIDMEDESQSVRQNIIQEFQTNLQKIDSVLIKNAIYTSYLDSIVRLQPETVNSFYFDYDFELFTHSAWDIAQNNSSTSLIETQFLLDAADIYHMQNFLEGFAGSVFENIGMALMRKNELQDYNMALSVYYSVNLMNNVSQSLKESYQEFLEKYDTNGVEE
ncbi:hypothetical protein [Ekhidna sp. To15]|uniref:hypothetical protein n=1 Tax=Ekhidna sp. To15 TaxID=3395267 RepID=UPI003F51E9BE